MIEEGKVQSNAQNIQRSRAKKAALKTTMLNSYAQLLEEKVPRVDRRVYRSENGLPDFARPVGRKPSKTN